MKSLTITLLVINFTFILQVASLDAALLHNEIKIQPTGVKHGPEFGNGWSEDQKIVWEKTQEWWQLYIAGDWSRFTNLFHQDAILYSNSYKTPYNLNSPEQKSRKGHSDVQGFGQMYCIVHEIRIIENIAIVMLSSQIDEMFGSKRNTYVWMKQDGGWKLIAFINKEE